MDTKSIILASKNYFEMRSSIIPQSEDLIPFTLSLAAR